MSQDLNFLLQSRNYSGRNFRPIPEVLADTEAKLLIIATPWGNRATAQKAIEQIQSHFVLSRGDHEATRIAEATPGFSGPLQTLKSAVVTANETILREENSEELRGGAEILAMVMNDHELFWVQVGGPHILLQRKHGRLLHLGSYVDLALDFTQGKDLLPALPGPMLGVEPSIVLQSGSFRPQEGDELLLLSHSAPPKGLYSFEGSALALDDVTKMIALDQPEHAFWIGLVQLQLSKGESDHVDVAV